MKIRNAILAAASGIALCTVAVSVCLSGAAMAANVGKAEIYFCDDKWNTQYFGEESDDSDDMIVTKAVIDDNGSYTAEISLEDALSGVAFIALCTDIGENTMPDGMQVEIDSVKVNGQFIDFAVNGQPEWKSDGGLMRVNIYNGWSEDKKDWAVDPKNFMGAKKITVAFTVSGLKGMNAMTEAPVTTVTEAVTTVTTTAVTEPLTVTEAVTEQVTEPVTEEVVVEEPEVIVTVSDDVGETEEAVETEIAEDAAETEEFVENADTGNAPKVAVCVLAGISSLVLIANRKRRYE